MVVRDTPSSSALSLTVLLGFFTTFARKISLSTTVSGLPWSSFVRLSSPVPNFAYQRREVRSFTEPFPNAALCLLFYSYRHSALNSLKRSLKRSSSLGIAAKEDWLEKERIGKRCRTCLSELLFE